MSIKERLEDVRFNVSEAAKASGRDPSDITLLAVSKFMENDTVREALEAGARDFGESRVQELTGKLELFSEYGAHVHLIGQLQTNKVKYIIGKVDTIQSLDRLELAQEISRQAVKRGVHQNVLIEVNIGEEPQKGGIEPRELENFIVTISDMPGLGVKGLMCIPPAVGEEETAKYFAGMKALFDRFKTLDIENVSMDILSMGMSGDYRAAIANGSNMVRVGTAIFGSRPKLPAGKA